SAAAVGGELEAVRRVGRSDLGAEGVLLDVQALQDHDRELALSRRWCAPARRGRVLVTQLDPEVVVTALRGSSADRAALRERKPRRERSGENSVLIRQGGTAAPGAVERLAVRLSCEPLRHVVAVVRESEGEGHRHDDECGEGDQKQTSCKTTHATPFRWHPGSTDPCLDGPMVARRTDGPQPARAIPQNSLHV